MQRLDNDMDDLFRKAAENYPLKTELKKWGDIVPPAKDTMDSPVLKNTGGKKYKWFFVLSLFFLVTAASLVFVFSNSELAATDDTLHNSVAKTQNAKNSSLPKKSLQSPNTMQQHSITSTTIPGETGNLAFNEITLSAKDARGPTVLNRTDVTRGNKFHPAVAKNQSLSFNKTVNSKKEDNGNNGTTPFLAERSGLYHISATGTRHYSDMEDALVFAGPVQARQSERAQSYNSNVKQEALPVIKKKANTGTPGFYLGLEAGLQANQVKMQGFNEAGISVGLLGGYQFNKRISLETGLFYSRKHYFSMGDHFHMTGSSMEVISLNGTSNIFEIPVKLKYDFAKGYKSSWFVTGGFSSYILTNENNDYFAMVNGSEQNVKASYVTKRGYFSAALHFSAGYELFSGNKCKLRIEPYLQIPLKGIGIGAMPVMTAGFHVGLTRSLRK